jgi:hypothetical protein
VRAYSGTFNVTDYRWFNLRDSNSSPSGSLPGAATTFSTDGLLRADYSAKPAYAAYQTAIARYGRCAPVSMRIALRRERRAVRRAAVWLGRRRVGLARGRRLRSVRVALGTPPATAFALRFVLRLRGGRTVSYWRRYRIANCQVTRT